MLFNTLLGLNILCIGLYFYVLISKKTKIIISVFSFV